MARLKDPLKRQLILDRALELIAARGYHAVSVKDIAQASSISLGSMYTYFDSKEQLVNELFRHWKRIFVQVVGEGDESFSLAAPASTPAAPPLSGRLAHQRFCHQLGVFIRGYPSAFLFLEAQLHADYLDQESLKLEAQITAQGLEFYKKTLGISLNCSAAQLVLSASFGAFVQVFKAHRAGLLELNQATMERLEALLWSMITAGTESPIPGADAD